MRADHPSPSTLDRFAAGELADDEHRLVARHLMGGCRRCRERVPGWGVAGFASDEEVAEGDLEVPPGSAAERILRTLRERLALMDAERLQVPALLDELLAHPPLRRQTLVRNSDRFLTWSLCEALLDRAMEQEFEQPTEALELVNTARTVAERLDPERYGARQLADLRARAWGYLGNACRVLADDRGAEAAFARVPALLDAGTGDPIEEALCLRLLCSLRKDQGRYREAAELARRSRQLSLSCGDRHHAGICLLLEALTHRTEGDPEEAIDLLEQALELVEPERDSRILLILRHNLALFLNEAGRPRQAHRLIRELRPAMAGETRLHRLRFRWLEGKVLFSRGDLDGAEAAFLEVRDGMLEARLPFDAALSCLDLALVYLRQRRPAEVKRLASQMLPVFRSHQIRPEATAALLLFHRAAQAERATAALLRKLATFLERARTEPKLRLPSG